MKVSDPCGCFPTGRHYPGIAHLMAGVRVAGVASELEAESAWGEHLVAFLDVETTGLDPSTNRVIEVGIVLGRRGEIVSRHGWLIDPQMPIPAESTAVHHISDADVAGQPTFAQLAPELLALLEGALPAAYNAAFDRGFILAEFQRAGALPASLPPALRPDVDWLDPLPFVRQLYTGSARLGEVASRLGISLENAHRATDDAAAALQVLYAVGKDARVPRAYGAFVQEQRRLVREQDARFRKRGR